MVRLSFRLLLIGCLASTGVPLSADTPNPRKDTAVVHLDAGDALTTMGPVSFYFNPKELPVDKTVPWQKHKAIEGDQPELEFTSADGRSMSLELMFDAFEQSGNNTTTAPKFVAALQDLVGKQTEIPVTIQDKLWMMRLGSVKPRFTRFDPRGNPTRAIVSTFWTSFVPVEPSDEVPFSVEIPGCPEATTAMREVDIDPVVIGAPVPAPRHARFTMAVPHGIVYPELLRWKEQSDAGIDSRRPIVLTLFSRDRVPVRRLTFEAAGPVLLTVDDPSAVVPYLTLDVTTSTVVIDPLEAPPAPAAVAAAVPAVQAPPTTTPSPFFGVLVTIQTATEQGTAFFKSVGGLKMDTEVTDYQEGGIHASTRKVIGVTKWPNLTLVGTPDRPQPTFQGWLNRPSKATLTITPLYLYNGQPRPTRSLVLQAAEPDAYVVPRLSAVRSNGVVNERISLAPAYGALEPLPPPQLPQ